MRTTIAPTTHIVAGLEESIAAEVALATAELRRRAEEERQLATRLNAAWHLLDEAGLLD